MPDRLCRCVTCVTCVTRSGAGKCNLWLHVWNTRQNNKQDKKKHKKQSQANRTQAVGTRSTGWQLAPLASRVRADCRWRCCCPLTHSRSSARGAALRLPPPLNHSLIINFLACYSSPNTCRQATVGVEEGCVGGEDVTGQAVGFGGRGVVSPT